MRNFSRRVAAAGAAAALGILTTIGLAGTPAAAHTVGEPGAETMLVHLNDSAAGGSYHQEFERAYAG
ncbi:MAG TPA: hypothetical protein VE645_08840, partial [Pseudonocardiaceae bacterium]|nr:hypothetical protein [Pseudonocardiaceae bacterium]